ncbi:hypothetical protein B7R22_05565 [Subtercola boreus]|uniref:wHTH-Hsp90 Na associated domain-containing protein n=1 Tax=Subtercola boreus TaxID=120213 RepID=A0A3E0W1K2_9MICO|nr:hypothetical protein B7R22_05565 [Subtercola boreus]
MRELLMGENLYGDPSLALRELYQNAVDACRLATARREFVDPDRHSSLDSDDRDDSDDNSDGDIHDASAMAIEIEIEQGVDAAGRAFVDFVDTGAGMGPAEFEQAFCQAGVRASDLSERIEEAAAFAKADPPVELWQNSRFGIGVLSYFMIADALTVTTTRLNRDGSVGDALRAHIPGPTAEFDLNRDAPAPSHGTRVRLWLKPGMNVSALTTLRNLVLVCPFRLRVSDRDSLEHRWAPGVLNRGSALLPGVADAVRTGPELWWTSGWGAVLADGIWIDASRSGMVVNLAGPSAPPLTADRRRAVRLDEGVIDALAVGRAAAAIDQAWHIVGDPGWLSRTSAFSLKIADALVLRAIEHQPTRSHLHGHEYAIGVAGYTLGDEYSGPAGHTDSVLQWRFSRLRSGGMFEAVGIAPTETAPVPALPSDAVFLGAAGGSQQIGTTDAASPWFGSAASVYEAERLLGHPVARIVERARELGLRVPRDADSLPESDPIVRASLSFNGRADADGEPLPVTGLAILLCARQLDVSTEQVVAALDARGIDFADRARTLHSSPLSPGVLRAMSENGEGIAPWRNAVWMIGLEHIVAASRASGLTVATLLAELRALGFAKLPDLELDGKDVTDGDLVLLSCDQDSRSPFYDRSQPMPGERMAEAAERLGLSEETLASRLASFGVSVVTTPRRPPSVGLTKKKVLKLLGMSTKQRAAVTAHDLARISRDGDGEAPWLDPRKTVPAWVVAGSALRDGSVGVVVSELRELGYTVEDPRTAPLTAVPGTQGGSPSRATDTPAAPGGPPAGAGGQ